MGAVGVVVSRRDYCRLGAFTFLRMTTVAFAVRVFPKGLEWESGDWSGRNSTTTG